MPVIPQNLHSYLLELLSYIILVIEMPLFMSLFAEEKHNQISEIATTLKMTEMLRRVVW
jgi:hypothetical protein